MNYLGKLLILAFFLFAALNTFQQGNIIGATILAGIGFYLALSD